MEPAAPAALELSRLSDDELLAAARLRTLESARRGPPAGRIEMRLTLDQASYLYEKLCRVVVYPPRSRPGTARKEAITDPGYLYARLTKSLFRMRQTAPVVEGERGSLSFPRQKLTLSVLPHEGAFLRRMLANRLHDDWRRQQRKREIFTRLEAVERAESGADEEGERQSLYRPDPSENPESRMRRALLQRALEDLPKKLKLPPEDVTVLLAALLEAEGNVSEAARELGLPQRKTARLVARIARHLESRGLSA